MNKLLPFILLVFLFSCDNQQVNLDEITDPEMKMGELRFDGPAKFAAAHALIRTSPGEAVPAYKVGDIQREYEKAMAKNASRTRMPLEWNERGPANCGGRTRGLIVDPADPTSSTWFLGSVGGGIWKTSNAGLNWELLTEDIPNLATSTLAMAPSNNDVIYAGTGEAFGNIDGILGGGMLKSTDRGETWATLASTENNAAFANVARLIINPEDENELVVATVGEFIDGVRRSSVMKSSDGGETWTETYFTSAGRVQQIIHPDGDFDTQYISVNSRGVFRSEDAGDSWERVWDARLERVDRMELAIAPQNPDVIYLSCEADDGSKLFYTRDAFANVFQPIYDGRQPNWLASQGWYDNTIAVHPYNDSVVWVAGAGPILELQMGNTFGTFLVFDEFVNNTDFLIDIENSFFNDESAGLSSSLFQGLPYNAETTDDDFVEVEIRFGPGVSQKAHLMDVDVYTYDFTYNAMIDVPFEAYNSETGEQISLSVFDVNGDEQWTYENYEGQGFPMHDVVGINTIAYDELGNSRIQTDNPIYKSQYYFFLQRDTTFVGDETDFPNANFLYTKTTNEGIVSEFLPIADGYRQYTDVANVGTKGVHVDHHNIVLLPQNDSAETFYVLNANDGGVSFSRDNGESFVQTGSTFDDGQGGILYGYNVSQFYGIDKMSGGDRYVGGTQDNGTWVSDLDPDQTSNWESAPSGDGFEAAWNYDDPNQILETSQFNGMWKSSDAGESWDRIRLPGGDGPFITRLASSQIDADLVFMVSEEGVLKSSNFGDSWEVIDMPSDWRFNGSWGPPIEISLANPDVVWTGGSMQNGNGLAFTVGGGDEFFMASNYQFAEMGTITGLSTNPLDPAIAYALFSQANGPKILRTDDYGQNWKDLSGFFVNTEESSNGFPDVATYSLLVMPWDTSWMWAGTEVGIVESRDGGETWNLADNGLPPVSIWEMKIVDDEIVLATHGRGIWSIDVNQLNPVSTNNPEFLNAIDLSVSPNPVNQQATIRYELDKRDQVRIKLFDLAGRQVQNVFNGVQSAGAHEHELLRENLVSGMYLLQLKTNDGIATRKIQIQ